MGIFLTVFFDLLGFGMFIPDLQLRGKHVALELLGSGFSDSDPRVSLLTGLALASFSFAQLLTAPLMGRLSDRAGRRKVLLITTILSTCAYAVYAHTDTYWLMVLSRAISGIAAANIGVAFAYVADITTPENRAKGMGTIGAAFGLGFIFGPPLGGLLLREGHDSPLLLGYVGAGMSFLNFLYVYFLLPETPQRDHEPSHLFADLKLAFATPGLSLLLLMFFSINLAFTNLETTFFQLLADSRTVFHLGDLEAKHVGSFLLAFVGIVAAIMQGGIVRRVTPKYGEVNILRFAYFAYAPALAAVPFAPLYLPILLAQFVLGTAMGLAQPSISSLISRSAPRRLQGGVFGITQSLGALARCIGPLISNPLFGWKPYAPYALGALIILFPAFSAWRLKAPESAAA